MVNAACTLTFSTATAWINLYRNLGVDNLFDLRPAVPVSAAGSAVLALFVSLPFNQVNAGLEEVQRNSHFLQGTCCNLILVTYVNLRAKCAFK